MRINVYAEEMTNRVAIVEKNGFTGLRIYLHLPVTLPTLDGPMQVKGPFMHHPDDDDSSAVTFWGKRDLMDTLAVALSVLQRHYDLHDGGTEHTEDFL